MPKKSRRKKPGPKKGSHRTFTRAGLPLDENRARALFGPADGKDGAYWAHQTWIGLHPETGMAQKLNAEHHGKEMADRLAVMRAETAKQEFSEESVRRFIDGDAEFFREVAAAMEQIGPKGWIAHDKQRVALSVYVLFEQQKSPSRQFTVSELLSEKVEWGKYRPGERHLKRLTKELGIPMQRGAPKKGAN